MINWLASYPKSGNTFIRLLLDATLEGSLDINNLQHSGAISLRGMWHHLNVDKMDMITQVSFSPAAMLAEIQHKNSTLIKTHHANFILEGWQLLPKHLSARAVYIVRDPRDVAVSVADHFGISLDDAITSMADEQKIIGDGTKGNNYQFLSSWSNHVSSFVRTDWFPVCVVKYENLLADPETHFGQVLDFLGLQYTSEQLQKGCALASFAAVSEQESVKGFRENVNHQESFFRRGTSGHWRDILTQEQSRKICSDHSEMMAKVGYSFK